MKLFYGNQKVVLSLVILALSALFFSAACYAVAFRSITEDGTRKFVCENSCGTVRVKKIDRNRYRVFSIGYSGDLVAGSEKEAAEKACGERDMTGAKRNPAAADRGGACR